MTNIAKIFTVAATLVVGTSAIGGMALANINPFAPDELNGSNVSVPWSKVGSGIPAPYRVGNEADERSLPLFHAPSAASGVPAPYRIGN
jgi:hypothetical protein